MQQKVQPHKAREVKTSSNPDLQQLLVVLRRMLLPAITGMRRDVRQTLGDVILLDMNKTVLAINNAHSARKAEVRVENIDAAHESVKIIELNLMSCKEMRAISTKILASSLEFLREIKTQLTKWRSYTAKYEVA